MIDNRNRRMRVLGVLAALAGLAGAATGCDDANQKDVKGVPGQRPEAITVYTNVDQHPNFARVCAGGIAFLTTSREYPSIARLPEWDYTCPKPPGFQPYKGAPTNLQIPQPAPSQAEDDTAS